MTQSCAIDLSPILRLYPVYRTFFAYANNYLIDVKFGIIMDVEASRAIRQAEVGASQTMIERTEACFGIKPEWLAADTAYGSAPNLDWLVNQQEIAPHVPVIDKSQREDGTFSREQFSYDDRRDIYTCPAGKTLATTGHISSDHAVRYLASVPECRACPVCTDNFIRMISRKNRLTSAHHDRAPKFRTGRLGRAIQVEGPA